VNGGHGPAAAVQQAVSALAAGGMIVVLDDADRENKGDLVVAAELVTEAQMASIDALQEQGLDTVEAHRVQALPVDSRTGEVGAQILGDLGISRLRLITNDPAESAGLDGLGLQVVGRVAMPVLATPQSTRHLSTKRDRMGHCFDPETSSPVPGGSVATGGR
jgi:3,4-dihydroxy 2-butanone 4-phosphate synthase/GTP cyclohydrolase II